MLILRSLVGTVLFSGISGFSGVFAEEEAEAEAEADGISPLVLICGKTLAMVSGAKGPSLVLHKDTQVPTEPPSAD